MDPELNEGQPATDTTPTDAAPDTPEPTIEEAALAAMDAGLAGEDAGDPPAAAAPAADEPRKEAQEADPVPGTPEAAAADAAKAEADKAKAAPDEATETEITALGLKEKAAERFRALTSEVKELAPIKEAMEKAGIKDVGELPQLAQHAQFGRELYQQVQETGASAAQYGQALDYLRVVGRANQGDMKAAEMAYGVLTEELTALAKMLGKEIPGVVDPLADHADLLAEVESGDLPRARALEIAGQRTAATLQHARQTATEHHGQAEAAQQQGMQDLNTLGAELQAADPHYAAKAPILVAQLKEIRDDLPPAKWAAAARRLYATIPNPVAAAPAPAPAPARPAPGPVRGNSVRPVVVPVSDDPLEAMSQGIAAATY